MRGDRYCRDGVLVQGDAEERVWIVGGRDRRTSGGEVPNQWWVVLVSHNFP